MTRRLLIEALGKWGYEVLVTHNGEQAWEELQRSAAPGMAILDWMMPGIDGLELIRHVRARPRRVPTYLILLTARADQESVATGLQAGANDYLVKPVNLPALRVCVEGGLEMVAWQTQLAHRATQLEHALADVRGRGWGRFAEG